MRGLILLLITHGYMVVFGLPRTMLINDIGASVTTVENVYVPHSNWHQQFKIPIPCTSSTTFVLTIEYLNSMLQTLSNVEQAVKTLHKSLDSAVAERKLDNATYDSFIHRMTTLASLRVGLYSAITSLQINSKVIIAALNNLGGYIPMNQCSKLAQVWNATMLEQEYKRFHSGVEAKRVKREVPTHYFHNNFESTAVIHYNLGGKSSTGEHNSEPHQKPVSDQGSTTSRGSTASWSKFPSATRTQQQYATDNVINTINKKKTLAEDHFINVIPTNDIHQQSVEQNVLDFLQPPMDDPTKQNQGTNYLQCHYPEQFTNGFLHACIRYISGSDYCQNIPLDYAHMGKFIKDFVNPQIKNVFNNNHRVKRNVDVDLENTDTYMADRPIRSYIPTKVAPLGFFDGGIWNIALNSNLNTVARTVNDLNREHKKLTLATIDNSKSIIAVAEVVDTNFKMLTTKLQHTVNESNAIFIQFNDRLNRVVGNLNIHNDNTQYIRNLDLIETTLLHTLFYYQQTSDSASNLMLEFNQILKAITHKRLPESLLQSAWLTSQLEEISRQLNSNFRFATSLDIQPFFKENSAYVSVEGKNIVFSYTIPIVAQHNTVHTYHVQTVPIWLHNTWVEMTKSGFYYLIDVEEKTWVTLSAEEYLACRADPFNTCDMSLVIWKGGDDKCIISPLLNMTTSVSDCMLQKVSVNPKVTSIIKAVDICEWVISPSHVPLTTTTKCTPSLAHKSADILTQVIKKITLISLDRGCELTTANFSLKCPIIVLSDIDLINHGSSPAPTINVLNNRGLMFTDINTIVALDTDKDQIDMFKNQPLSSLTYVNDSLIKSSFVNLNDIIDYAKGSSPIYFDERESFKSWSNSISNSVLEEWSTLDAIVPNWKRVGVIYAVCISSLSFLVVLWLCYKLHVRNLAVAGATLLPLTQSTWAIDVFTSNNTTLAPMLIAAATNETSVASPVNKTKVVTDTLFCDIQYIQLGVLMMFFLLHCIISLIMYKAFKQTQIKAQIRSGYIPKNLLIDHHIGEVHLVACVLIKIKRFYSEKFIKREIMVDICTLPRSFDEWYCAVKDKKYHLFNETTNTRLSAYWYFSLKWGSLCIKSTMSPNIDTCTELPTLIKVSSQEITNQLDDINLPFWYSVVTEGIVTLHLVGRGYHRVIFNIADTSDQIVVSA